MPNDLDVALGLEAQLALDVDLHPEALAVEAVLPALVLAEHRVEALVEVLVGAAPGVVDAHRVVGGDRPVEERPARLQPSFARSCAAGVLCAQLLERAALPPEIEHAVLEDGEVGLCGDDGKDGLRHGDRIRIAERVRRLGRPTLRPWEGVRSDFWLSSAPMQTPERVEKQRSPFAAAFFSSIQPGLGQIYVGRWARGLAWAAPTILFYAFTAGVVRSMGLTDFAAQFLAPSWLLGPAASSWSSTSSTASRRPSTPTALRPRTPGPQAVGRSRRSPWPA